MNIANNHQGHLVLGINSAYHEPAACLTRDGHLAAAAEEERFNRIRHGKPANLLNPHDLPENSIRFCLEQAGIGASDIERIGYSFKPDKRRGLNVGVDMETVAGCAGTPEGENKFHELMLTVPQRLSELLRQDITSRFEWIEHHLCHAASAYYPSPYAEAAILSTDGIGEATSTWMGVGSGNRIEPIKEIQYPHSLGFLWTKLSRFLGFGDYGQWKVMGLAAFGNPDRYYRAFREFVSYDDAGMFLIDNETMQFRVDRYNGFERLFGSLRRPGETVDKRHMDIAAALQKLTNEVMLGFARHLHAVTGMKNLCQAGGVALNCVANRVILEEGPFENVFIQPAANDAGTAMGACQYIWHHMMGNPKQDGGMQHAYLGPAHDPEEGKKELFPAAEKVGDIEKEVARLLADGEIVAWFQGRMEWGPRALGNRSILADPRRADMVHTINEKIKHREFFRPFAASVLADKAEDWFEFKKHAPGDSFMLYAREVKPEQLGKIPAVTHVDDTSRIQCVEAETNPRFDRLIREFEALTGVPMVLNTSFNDREPIICTPENAVETCVKAGIRYLAIGDYLVDFRKEETADFAAMVTDRENRAEHVPAAKESVQLAFRSR